MSSNGMSLNYEDFKATDSMGLIKPRYSLCLMIDFFSLLQKKIFGFHICISSHNILALGADFRNVVCAFWYGYSLSCVLLKSIDSKINCGWLQNYLVIKLLHAIF